MRNLISVHIFFGIARRRKRRSVVDKVRMWPMLELNHGASWFDKIQLLSDRGLVTMSNSLRDKLPNKCLEFIYNRKYDRISPPFIVNAIECTADRLVICKSQRNSLVSSDQPLRFPCISQNSRRKRQGKSHSYINSLKKDQCFE